MASKTVQRPGWLTPQRYLPFRLWDGSGTLLLNLFAGLLLLFYLLPMAYMLSTSFMGSDQLGDRFAPPYPARQETFEYQGEELGVYQVPIEGETRHLALVTPGRTASHFVDPQHPEEGLIDWQGSWRRLPGVYRFHLSWDSFARVFRNLRFPQMIRNTLLAALISGVGVLVSSIVVAYGFARFPLPGGNLLFYLLIATMLIPDKVTLIPTYFTFVRILNWDGTWLPILLPFFFGNAIYIFLLRQNFRSIPKEMEEAAMLDGAGPLRILAQIILPQTWPAVITVTLLHFFYIWNETRQVSLYLSTNRDLIPVSFGVQAFQSLVPFQNLLQASALLIMIVPVLVLFLAQRYFMRNLVITGMEKV